MGPRIYVTRGDLSRLRVDALVYSTSTTLGQSGDLYEALRRLPGFTAATDGLSPNPPFSEVGDACWLPLDAPGHTHGVVAVATRGRERVRSGDVARATESALRRSIVHLEGKRSLAYGGRDHWLVAMPSLGTGSAGAHDPPAQLAAAQVAAVRAVQRDEPRLDVALVGFTAAGHHHFLAARGPLPRSALHHEAAQSLARAILDDACVLFVGAGLSAGAGLPGWRTLLEELVARRGELGGLEVRDDAYERIAQVCADLAALRGGVTPGDLVDERFGAQRTFPRVPEHPREAHVPTLAHYLLLQLPFRYVVTTNYDHLIEQALEGIGRPWFRVVDDGQVAGSGIMSGTTVVKLHGSAAEHAGDRARALVLTRREYDRFDEEHRAKVALLQGLLLNHHFFFAGYGLADRDFRALYGRVAEMLKKTQREAFAVDFEAAGLPPGYGGTTTLPFVAPTLPEKVRAFWGWLDDLAASAAGAPETFLGDREPPQSDAVLVGAHAHLTAIGEDFEAHWDRAWASREVRVLRPILELLQRLGWRPHRRVLGVEHTLRWTRVWQHLASCVEDDPRLRRELLGLAFASAERVEHAEELAEALRLHDRGRR